MMIRPKRLLDHVGCFPQVHPKGWNNNQGSDFGIQWPTGTARITENWSKLAVLPSICRSGDQNTTPSEMNTGREYTGCKNTSEVRSYSQIREQWLRVKNSNHISQSVKDQIHEIYLDETTNHLNQLVFGGPDMNVISLCSETEVKQPADGDSGHNQGPCLLPKPPVSPRGPSTRRSRRMTQIRATQSGTTSLSPVIESPRQA